MQITRVEAFPLRYREPNDNQNLRYITLARVETNDGAVGWGECISQWPESAQAVKIIVERGLAPVLLGRDPRETEALWQAMKAHTWWYGDGGIASFALSALDMACWDLKGKALGVPLYQLLGGKVNAKLRACASTHPNRATIDALAAELAGYAQQGYTALKVGFGKRGEARLGYEAERDAGVEMLTMLEPRARRRSPDVLLHRGVDLGADSGHHAGHGAGQASAGRRAEQDGPIDHGLTRLVALEPDRLGQTDLLGDHPPDRGVDQLLVAVRHLQPP